MAEDVPLPLLQQRGRFERAFSEGDLDVVGDLLTDDVLWVLAGRPPWIGSGEVVSGLRGFFDTFTYGFQLGEPDVDAAGDRATDRTTFTSHITDRQSGETARHHGAYVMVWRELDDWRVAAYVDVSAGT